MHSGPSDPPREEAGEEEVRRPQVSIPVSSTPAANVRKHGVSFEEAASVFADPLALAVEDAVDPGRTVLIGMSERLRVLLTVYTDIDQDTIRIISARRATSHERRHYEEGT
jgi:uncharacterized protein